MIIIGGSGSMYEETAEYAAKLSSADHIVPDPFSEKSHAGIKKMQPFYPVLLL